MCAELERLTTLTSLSMRDFVGPETAPALQSLDLSRLANLVSLQLLSVHLPQLLPAISPLTGLTSLVLSNNNLVGIPSAIKSLAGLRELHIVGPANNVGALLSDITKLSALSVLELR